jgi:hypothetical protein
MKYRRRKLHNEELLNFYLLKTNYMQQIRVFIELQD